jgi:hypothetical protein
VNTPQVAVILYNTLGLVALWGVALRWRAYKVEKLRQEIFNLRGELFDFARAGGVTFTNRSYDRLRMLLNSMIRFAHELSFVRLAVTLALEHWRPILTTGPSFVDELRADSLDRNARLKMEQIHNRLMSLVMIHILTTSVTAWPSLPLYFVYTLLKHGLPERRTNDPEMHSVRQIVLENRLQSHLQLMERQAIETRELELRKHEAAVC